MIGETVGNYRVLKLIGQGGMGVVYLAEHPAIGRKAAIKVLRADTARSPEAVIRFFNEARAANAVHHPGVVEVFDYGALPSGAAYIAMELLEGESLATRLARLGRLPAVMAVEIARQTADVLAATHAAGVVHRDLKPDNLYLVRDPRAPGREVVKVLDFGVAKLNVHASGSAGLRTRTGAVLGTPVYMSPEQCRGARDVDQRTDVYALGVILYEMLCGRPPFVSDGQGELIDMHINVAPEPPRRLEASIPESLERAILKALVKDPGGRHQTMSALQRALAGGAREAEIRSVTTAVGPATTFSQAARAAEVTIPMRRPGRWPFVVVGVLLMATVLVRRWPRPRAETAQAITKPVASVPVAPAQVAAPRAPAPPETAVVSITSVPPGARLVRERDAADIGATPFKESWRVGPGIERVRLELDGYRAETFAVPLDHGVDLTFVLKKTPRAPYKTFAPRAPGPPPPIDQTPQTPLEPAPL
ncbi:MAG TPA: serine/threonine-protein kinase [Polyangia bacterium]|nr:serine/threonine-protein kinase [Polyangia bacterium]